MKYRRWDEKGHRMYHDDEFYWLIVAATALILLLLAVVPPMVERYKRWKFDRAARLRDRT